MSEEEKKEEVGQEDFVATEYLRSYIFRCNGFVYRLECDPKSLIKDVIEGAEFFLVKAKEKDAEDEAKKAEAIAAAAEKGEDE